MKKSNFLRSGLNALKALGKRMLGLDTGPEQFKPHLLGVSEVSLGERELPLDAFSVKRKLGASFFTRRLTGRTRHARVSSLTNAERAIARARRWI